MHRLYIATSECTAGHDLHGASLKYTLHDQYTLQVRIALLIPTNKTDLKDVALTIFIANSAMCIYNFAVFEQSEEQLKPPAGGIGQFW